MLPAKGIATATTPLRELLVATWPGQVSGR